jgi:hypothetical protein
MECFMEKARKYSEVYIYGFGISGKWLAQQLIVAGISVVFFVGGLWPARRICDVRKVKKSSGRRH